MARAWIEPVLLFLTPFALYALYLVARRRMPHSTHHWSPAAVAALTVAGLCLAIGGLVLIGAKQPREQGAYRPAHIENGRLVPGRFE